MTAVQKAKQLASSPGFLRMQAYQEAMRQLRYEDISDADRAFLIDLYDSTKDMFTRNQILVALVLCGRDPELEGFFLTAAKRERHLDMRLTAIRGYAAYATEAEVIPLMAKFTTDLARIPEHTPLAYQVYEILRSAFGLPYLVDRYGYECFTAALAQVEAQYQDMPEGARGIFTLDAWREPVVLKTPDQAREGLDEALRAISLRPADSG